MIGIHINDKKIAYTDMILDGFKTMETRFKATLHPFIGQRVAIVRTGKGPAAVVGTVEITGAVWYGAEAFDQLRHRHRVPAGSEQDVGGKHIGKWCYLLKNPARFEKPIVIGNKGYTGNRTYRIVDLEEGM